MMCADMRRRPQFGRLPSPGPLCLEVPMRSRSFPLVVVVLAALAPLAAHARPSFPGFIPNGNAADGRGCINCHVSAQGGGQRNTFGIAVAQSLVTTPDWAALCHLDSDGDGQTNGQELGDPGCIWLHL